jgi:integrase/recombinase XerD
MGSQKKRAWTPATPRQYVQNAIARAPLPTRSALRAFAAWLEHDRRLELGSIVVRIQSVRWFVEAVCSRAGTSTSKAFRTVTAKGIEDFFVDYAKDTGPVVRRSMQSAMRSFLKFAALKGWVREELAAAVPSLRRYRLSSLPRAIAEKDLQQLLRSIASDGTSARDQAIVFLLAVYGVRSVQVSGIRLEDIDWRARTIQFRAHKGGKSILHELVPAIAATLVRYLRDERPYSDDPFVFVRKRSPHSRLSPAALKPVLAACIHRSGLPQCSAHSLRHAFASRLLRHGQSLKTIADLLGHRSFSAVSIYAKVDHPRLLEVATEWPEACS